MIGLVSCLVVALMAGCGSSTEPDGDGDPGAGETVGPAGGEVATGSATLSVPPGALSEETGIVIEATTAAAVGIGSEFVAVDGTVYDFGPDGLLFDVPATLSVGYDPSALPDGVNEEELRILHVTAGGTMALESSVDEAGNTVSADIAGFSAFAVGVEVGDFTRIACPAFAPVASSGIPLDGVAAGSLPSSFELPAVVEAWSAADSLSSYGVVEVDADGSATIVVPLHPSGAPEGGEVVLTVTDGTRACAGVPFTIDPLPPAPGELGALTDALQSVLSAQAAVMETTVDELVSTPPDQLPTTLFPLALVQSVVDHPDNPRSLRALAEGTSPDAGDARLDLLEPLLARTGLRDALVQSAAAVHAAGTGSPPHTRSSADGTPASGGSASTAASGPALVPAWQCVPSQITSAQFLDACMSAAASAAFELNGASGKVLGDISTATGYLGLVPGVPALGTASAIGGAAAWTVLNAKQRTAATYPSVFTSMTVDATPSTFMEDQEGPGSWTATVRATSAPWDLGKVVLEGALQATGVLGNFDKVQVAGPEVDDLMSWFLTGPVASEALSEGTLEEFMIAAEETPEIPVSDEAYSESTVLGAAFEKTSHDEFEPREVGSSTLSVRTEDGAFGGQQIAEQEELTVDAIEISFTPSEVVLGAGEERTFTVTVTNSQFPEMVEVDESVSLQGTVTSFTSAGGGSHTLEYTAPSEPDPASPDLVTVRHTATTGARAFSSTPVTGFAVVRFPDVRVIPPTDCIRGGATVQFTAEIVGADDLDLEWTVDVGSIDTNTGEYTAPASVEVGQTATITATSTSNANITDSVTVDLGGCVCRFTANVDGSLFESADGDNGIVSYGPDGNLIVVTLGDRSADQALSITINPDGFGVAVGSTGTFPVMFGGTLGTGTGELGITSPDAQSAQIILETNTGTAVRGRAFGSAQFILDNGETREVSIDANFRFSDIDGVVVEGGRIFECVVGEEGQ